MRPYGDNPVPVRGRHQPRQAPAEVSLQVRQGHAAAARRQQVVGAGREAHAADLAAVEAVALEEPAAADVVEAAGGVLVARH